MCSECLIQARKQTIYQDYIVAMVDGLGSIPINDSTYDVVMSRWAPPVSSFSRFSSIGFYQFLSEQSPIIGNACHSLTDSLLFSKLDWCDVWLVKMPTQNLLSLLLLLMLMMRNVLTTVLCSFGSWSLVIKLNFVQTLSTRFGQEFEVEVQAKLLKLKFGQYFAAEAWWGYEVNVWSRFWC